MLLLELLVLEVDVLFWEFALPAAIPAALPAASACALSVSWASRADIDAELLPEDAAAAVPL